MLISRVILKNWRNFQDADIVLGDRAFLVGPNASGKSNFLDVFRFLRDISKSGGGLQWSVAERGGLPKIRCLAARRNPVVEIEVHLSETNNEQPVWTYRIGIVQEPRGLRRATLKYESVQKNGEMILDRPNHDDKNDPERLTQTALEQISANQPFRDISDFFQSTVYLHLIPQLLRFPKDFAMIESSDDPFGKNFLKKIAQTNVSTRQARFKTILTVLKKAIPQFEAIDLAVDDDDGTPHLEALYTHWRPKAGRQREDQFSDGTLRLIGFLWSLLEGDSLLLMEEPELSLHTGIVKKIPSLIHQISKKTKKKRQIFISTHSADLLSDQGIGGEEIIVLNPRKEGTELYPASAKPEIRTLLDAGFPPSEAVLPHTTTQEIEQLTLGL